MNYSYTIPNATPDTPIVKWLLGDWQVSGVTKYLSGTATQPSCSSNTPGIAFTNPTLTPLPQGQSARCVFTGEPIFDISRDPNLAEEDQLHFNPRAFAMAAPLSPTVGNFGNVPNGIFRHPGWWNWDVTFARRFPVPQMGSGAQVRLQLQIYNIFNMVQFTNLNTDLQFQDDPSVPGPGQSVADEYGSRPIHDDQQQHRDHAAAADRPHAPAGLLTSRRERLGT